MISAKEARKQSDQNKQNILNKEIAIIERISKVIHKGILSYLASTFSSVFGFFFNIWIK